MSDTRVDTHDVDKIPHLGSLGNVVPEGYEYYEKLVTPGEDLSLSNTYLKWYSIRRPDLEISQEYVSESRVFLEAEVEKLRIEGDLGFVLLHLCGPILLLLLMTWRKTNEIWESVYVKDLTQTGGFEPLMHESSHRETICVWELGPVWHERQAWVRYLQSSRDEEAKYAYLNDRFVGLC